MLLQALQEGALTGFVLLFNNTLRVDVPVEIWKRINETDFWVRRHRNGKWRSRKFRIPLQFAAHAATGVLRNALESVLSGDKEEFDRVCDFEWLRDLHFSWTQDIGTRIGLYRGLVDRLLAILDETAYDALVYVAKDEAAKLIAPQVSKKGKGGRYPLDSDKFWIDVLRITVKAKPKFSREQIKDKVLEQFRSEPDDITHPSPSWMKHKLKVAYNTLGWTNESDTVIEP